MTVRETLSLPNFDSANIAEELQLATDANPNQAIITVINPNNAVINEYLCLVPGRETSEIRRIQSISGNTITFTSNLSFQHRGHERVIRLFGDQIRVYRAPADLPIFVHIYIFEDEGRTY